MADRPMRRRWWIVGLVALVAVSGVSWWLGARSQSPEQAVAGAGEPNASWITAEVERRVLSSTVVLRGDVSAEVSLAVGVPSSVEGTPVVTRVPPAVGSVVDEGAVVIELSGRPVFVLRGEVPVYRSLRPGMTGLDVSQLQAALARLGYQPETDGVYGGATKQAVESFYLDAGFDPVPSATTTADVSAAELAYRLAETDLATAEDLLAKAKEGGTASEVATAQAAVNQAQRTLDDAQATRDDEVAAAEAELADAQAAYNLLAADPSAPPADVEAAESAVQEATSTLTTAQRRGADAVATAQDQLTVATLQLTEAERANDVGAAQIARDNAAAARDSAAASYMQIVGSTGATVAQGEIVFVPTMPARIQSAVTVLGPVGANTGAPNEQAVDPSNLVRLAAGELVVSARIKPGDDALVRTGMDVALLDEATNTEYPGTVTFVAERATADASGQLGRTIVVAPDAVLPGALAGLNVRVTVTAAATLGEVLVVPLAAVSSAADGSTRVSVLREGSDDPFDVPVTALMSANGFEAVEPLQPDALQPGDLVVVGR